MFLISIKRDVCERLDQKFVIPVELAEIKGKHLFLIIALVFKLFEYILNGLNGAVENQFKHDIFCPFIVLY